MFFILHPFANDVTGKKKKRTPDPRRVYTKKNYFFMKIAYLKALPLFFLIVSSFYVPYYSPLEGLGASYMQKKLRWIYRLPGLHLPAQS